MNESGAPGDARSQGFNRRDVLEILGKATALAAVGVGAGYVGLKYPKILDVFDNKKDELENIPEIRAAREYLKEEFGVITVAGDSWAGIHQASLPHPEYYTRALINLVETLEKYPRDLFKGKGTLIRIGERVRRPELYLNKQRTLWRHVDGLANTSMNFVMLDAETMIGPQASATLDHELYHLLDLRSRGVKDLSDKWVKLHTEMCQCSVYGEADENESVKELMQRIAMMSTQGIKNEVEDQATWAERLLNPKETRKLQTAVISTENFKEYLAERRAEVPESQLEPLRTLFIGLIDILKSNYARWSKGAMDETYWKDLSEKRDLNARGKAVVDGLRSAYVRENERPRQPA